MLLFCIQKSKIPLLQALWKQVQAHRMSGFPENSLEHYEEQKRKLIAGDYALIIPSDQAVYLQADHCDLVILADKIIQTMSSFIYPKGSPLPTGFSKE